MLEITGIDAARRGKGIFIMVTLILEKDCKAFLVDGEVICSECLVDSILIYGGSYRFQCRKRLPIKEHDMSHITDITAGHQYIPAIVDTGKDDSGKFTVPNAGTGSVGSVSLQEFIGTTFNATSSLTNSASDQSDGVYMSIDRTFYYQIAGGTPIEGCKQVSTGDVLFVNVSLAHGAKQGKGPKHFSYYHRPAQ